MVGLAKPRLTLKNSRQPGAAVLGNPLNVVAWLANELPKFGRKLQKGDKITTGLTTDVYLANPGDHLAADFGGAGPGGDGVCVSPVLVVLVGWVERVFERGPPAPPEAIGVAMVGLRSAGPGGDGVCVEAVLVGWVERVFERGPPAPPEAFRVAMVGLAKPRPTLPLPSHGCGTR